MPSVLWRLGAAAVVEQARVEDEHVRLHVGAPQTAVHPGNRVSLAVEVIPRPGVHIYGPGVGGGYQGLALAIDPQPWLTVYPVRYPPEEVLELPWDPETLTGYRGPVRVAVDVALGTRQELAGLLEAGQGLVLTGACRLQACDARRCWPPETLTVQWRFDLIAPDLARVPEHLQRRAKS